MIPERVTRLSARPSRSDGNGVVGQVDGGSVTLMPPISDPYICAIWHWEIYDGEVKAPTPPFSDPFGAHRRILIVDKNEQNQNPI